MTYERDLYMGYEGDPALAGVRSAIRTMFGRKPEDRQFDDLIGKLDEADTVASKNSEENR